MCFWLERLSVLCCLVLVLVTMCVVTIKLNLNSPGLVKNIQCRSFFFGGKKSGKQILNIFSIWPAVEETDLRDRFMKHSWCYLVVWTPPASNFDLMGERCRDLLERGRSQKNSTISRSKLWLRAQNSPNHALMWTTVEKVRSSCFC